MMAESRLNRHLPASETRAPNRPATKAELETAIRQFGAYTRQLTDPLNDRTASLDTTVRNIEELVLELDNAERLAKLAKYKMDAKERTAQDRVERRISLR